MIEKSFDVPFIANLALREKQIQQNFRPVIGVHKWFARGPGTLFRGLLLSEFGEGPLKDIFYQSHQFFEITVADPFMGGGTPIRQAEERWSSFEAKFVPAEDIPASDETDRLHRWGLARDLTHFLNGLSKVFQNMASALKPGAPFVFTYHHNDINAYLPIAVALLDARLVCSATLPFPAEMGASIHINGTGSSIVDTVFVCRTTGVVSRKTLTSSPEEIADLVLRDLDKLKAGNVRFSQGDIRCIAFGHLTRLAVWS